MDYKIYGDKTRMTGAIFYEQCEKELKKEETDYMIRKWLTHVENYEKLCQIYLGSFLKTTDETQG
jgi:hypothetical protein